MTLPMFPVTMVGSWPRPQKLLAAQKSKYRGSLSDADFNRAADEAVLEALRFQVEAGLDVVTDGEQRRDNFFAFVAEKLAGVKLMKLSEMLDIVEDRAGFERILQTLDVPAYSITNATCVGRVERVKPLAADDLRFLKRHTGKPVKITLPGPYLLTRAMYVPSASAATYPTKEDLGVDVVRVLRAELEELVREGADFIQFDEPVLTELVFTQGQTRTFMCASLAARKDPREELEFAVSLFNQVVGGIHGVRIGLHICRGNWSTNESTLLRGSYHPLAAYLDRMKVDQLVLEYATERAGDVIPIAGKELGLGAANPRTETIESVQEVRQSLQRALQVFPAEKLWLNPDCGFATFSNRPVNSAQISFQKLKVLVAAAQTLRG